MNLKTRYNLWRAKANLAPSSVFKAGLFTKLSADWDNIYSVRYAWFQMAWFKRGVAVAVVVLLLGSLGTGAYAYNSPEVTEGTPLYPIKQKLENIEEKLQITPEAKARFVLKKMHRREEEVDALKNRASNKNKYDIEKTEEQIKNLEDDLQTTEHELDEVKSSDTELKDKIKDRLEHKLEQRKEKLERKMDKLEKRFKAHEALEE